MKTFKLPLAIVALLLTTGVIFAFKTEPPKKNFAQWYVLKSGGTLLDRNDWEPVMIDPECPTTHTDEVCGIYAEDDNGVPSAASFTDIRTNSLDFAQAYPAKVQYRP